MKAWWRRRSLTTRLTVTYSVSMLALLTAYAGGVYAFVGHRLASDLNSDLHGDFEVVESMLALSADGSLRLASDRALPAMPPQAGSELNDVDNLRAEVWTPQGQLLVRTNAVAGWAGALPKSSGRESLELGGERVRVLQGPHAVAGRPVVVRVLRSEEPMLATLAMLRLITWLGLPLGVSIAAVTGHLIARQTLAPVARVTEQARVITAERLDQKLPIDNPYDEIGRLAAVFNHTFERLRLSFDQLRRFTADASHELRTPLTSLRSVGEVVLQREQTAEEYRDAIGSMLEEAERLSRLVSSLLTLSRADAGSLPQTRRPEDLTTLVHEIAEELAVLAEEKGQKIVVSGDPVHALVDRSVLRLSIVNLLDNAIEYGPVGSTIDVTVTALPGAARVEVRDHGPGIAAEHRELVFERFYRVDPARNRATGGAGLGLAIARWAAEAHCGSLALGDTATTGGAVFQLELPRSLGGNHDANT